MSKKKKKKKVNQYFPQLKDHNWYHEDNRAIKVQTGKFNTEG